MKKNNFSKLMILFSITLISSIFTGCSTSSMSDESINTSNVEESSSGNTSEVPVVETFELNDDLILSLKGYLIDKVTDHDDYFIPKTLETIIDEIKDGNNLMYVEFDPNKYYYACAYYDNESDYFYGHRDDYKWIGFYNEKDILKTYDGKELIATFQINKANTKLDVLSNTTITSNVEYYQFYNTNFNKGNKNINSSNDCCVSYLLQVQSYEENIYYGNEWLDRYVIIPFVEKNDQISIKRNISKSHIDNGELEANLNYEFGKYKDLILEVISIDTLITNDTVERYGTIELKDLVNIILNK